MFCTFLRTFPIFRVIFGSASELFSLPLGESGAPLDASSACMKGRLGRCAKVPHASPLGRLDLFGLGRTDNQQVHTHAQR